MTTQRETELLAANAALEAEIVRLREALKHIKYETDIHGNNLNRGIKDEAVKALSTQFIPQALPELIEKVEKMTIERCAKAVWNSKPSQKAIDEIPAAYQLASLAAIRALPTGQIKLEELL